MRGQEKAIAPRDVAAQARRPEELAYRLHQQSMLSEFGRQALEASAPDDLLDAAVRLCADGMHARFTKALEFLPERNGLLLRAGIGWRPGFVGHEVLDRETPAGAAFHTGRPVISNQLDETEGLRKSRLLMEHGVKRTVNVPVPIGAGGAGACWAPALSWADDRYALFGEVSYNTSLDHVGESYSYKGVAGLRARW